MSQLSTEHQVRAKLFAMLYEDYQKPIERYLGTQVYNQEQASDLCQETFKQLWEFLCKGTVVKQYAFYRNWLYKTATYRAIDHLRHTKKLDFHTLSGSEAELMVEEEAETIDWFTFQEALGQLPSMERDYLLEKYILGYSQKEIAEKNGVSESTVSEYLSRGKEHLNRKYYQVTFDLRVAEMKSAIRRSGLDFIFIYSEGPDETGFRQRKVCDAKQLCDLDDSDFAMEVLGKCEISWPASHHISRRWWRRLNRE